MSATTPPPPPTATWDFSTGTYEPIIVSAFSDPKQLEWMAEEGVTPDFLMENKDRPAIVGIIITAVLATLVVMLRLYARVIVVKKVGADDILAAISLVGCIECVDAE